MHKMKTYLYVAALFKPMQIRLKPREVEYIFEAQQRSQYEVIFVAGNCTAMPAAL